MAKTYSWKVWLRLNRMTKKVENDYIAEISTVGNTLHNEDIAQRIVENGSEFHYETILSILSKRDEEVRKTILAGASMQDSNIRLAPRITGKWTGADPLFNPNDHKITVDATPTAAFLKALDKDVGVEVLGRKIDGGAFIGLVTDKLTGKTDGTVTPAGDITISGEKIKIVPDNEDGLGVFFVDANGAAIPLDYPIVENKPKKILCRVPASLADGAYTLKIVTRFTSASVSLNEPRTITYELPLRVGVPTPDDGNRHDTATGVAATQQRALLRHGNGRCCDTATGVAATRQRALLRHGNGRCRASSQGISPPR